MTALFHSLESVLSKVQQAKQKLATADGSSGTCASLLDSLEPNTKEGGADGNFPFVALVIILAGSLGIGYFMSTEYSYIKAKMSSSKSPDFTIGDVIGYRLDFYLSSNKMAKPAMLFGVTFALILLSTVGLMVTGEDLSSAMWQSWTWVVDTGSHTDAESLDVRIVALVTTLGGMFVFAIMIGIITDFIGEKVDDLKKGKARVIESGHTLMLGWSEMSLAIVQQIALANESDGGGVIVVLAKNDKEAMEIDLEAAIESKDDGLDLKGTSVIFRSGCTLTEHELAKVSVEQARAIIALADGDDPDEADSRMVLQVMALKRILGRSKTNAHVVCELSDVDNRDLVEMVGEGLVEVVCPHDMIGRLMIGCARSAGLANVLENLMGFDGDEFYLKEWDALVGKRFGEIHCRFEHAVPLGIKHDDFVFVNPPDDMLVQAGDEILVLAEDDDSYTCNDGSAPPPRVGELPETLKAERKAEAVLLCGWRRDLADMIKELDAAAPPNSEIWLLNTVPVEKRAEELLDKGNKDELFLKNLKVFHALGKHYSRRDLQLLQALSEHTGKKIADKTRTLYDFDSILILSENALNIADVKTSDSRALTSLLLIRDMKTEQRKGGSRKFSISSGEAGIHQNLTNTRELCRPVAEILDPLCSELIKDFQDIGYVMSKRIVSAAIAQIAECRDMNPVLGELLRTEGNEVHVTPITLYIEQSKLDTPYSFWEVVQLARKRCQDTPEGKMAELAIGYKPYDVPWASAKETILNPPKKHEKRKWNEGDKLIVVAR